MAAIKFERTRKIEGFDGLQKNPQESDEVEVKLCAFALNFTSSSAPEFRPLQNNFTRLKDPQFAASPRSITRFQRLLRTLRLLAFSVGTVRLLTQ
jgi:hypothetical protein